jgi:hypothetical protein
MSEEKGALASYLVLLDIDSLVLAGHRHKPNQWM